MHFVNLGRSASERERERWVWRKGEDSREGGGGLMGLAGGNISDGHGDAFGIK